MKNITLLLAFFLGYCNFVSSQSFAKTADLNTSSGFEGIIEMVQTTPTVEYNMKWYIKDNKLAYELTFNNARGKYQIRFVPHKSTNSVLMVTGDSKIEIPSSEINSPEGFSLEGAKLKNNGKVKNPDFRKVNNWQISTSKFVSILEVTTDVDINFSEYKEFFKGDHGICALVESGKPGFLLNSTTLDSEGNLITKTTLKKVTRTKVSDSFFK
jgi:hypothetical protein